MNRKLPNTLVWLFIAAAYFLNTTSAGAGYHYDKPQGPGLQSEKPQGPGYHYDKPQGPGLSSVKPQSPSSHSDKPQAPSFQSDKPQSPGYHYDKPKGPGFHSENPQSAGFHTDKPQGPGYHYDKPARIPILMDNEVSNENDTTSNHQDDFIDDLVTNHKHEIFASLLPNNGLTFGPAIGPGFVPGYQPGIIQPVPFQPVYHPGLQPVYPTGFVAGGIPFPGQQPQQPQVPAPIQGATGTEDFSGDGGKALYTNRCAACTCGVPNINRIIGGTKVRTNKYPWIAQLIRGTSFFCGGTLINDRYVLTAAHCVHGMNIRTMTVRLLQFDRSSTDRGIVRRVVYAYEHSEYSSTTLVHDIALIRLDQPVPLLDPMRPACLPRTLNQNFDFKQGIVAGWGLTKENGQTSSILQEVAVPIITNEQCRATSYKSMIVDTMLCAGYVEQGGKDACQGDSGGPLIIHEGIFRLAGVVSFGYGCAKPDAPGVYTRVSRYLNWIVTNTQDACYCANSL